MPSSFSFHSRNHKTLESPECKDASSKSLITEFFGRFRAFQTKFQVFELELVEKLVSHSNHVVRTRHTMKVSELINELHEGYADFVNLDKDFSVFRNPFSVGVSEVPYIFSLKELKSSGI